MKIKFVGFVSKLYVIIFLINSLIEIGKVTLLESFFSYVLFVIGLVVIGVITTMKFNSQTSNSELFLAFFDVLVFVYLMFEIQQFRGDYYLWFPVSLLILVESVLIVVRAFKKKSI
ncbi:MAG: hypothetical protein OEY34_09005 [Cyclobacteriaceae bacterium]|nr:hypothetical protein [Cyclobacteriaceae bacterium]